MQNWRRHHEQVTDFRRSIGARRDLGICPDRRRLSEYYVVRDATTKKCTIVDKKPTTTTTTIVDNSTYKTRTEAESGMKTTKVCTEN